ncbi:MAG: TVP38/TMEM64 family protein [Oscillospiraceae bacterium]|nr:TVP38/TMEM64 family protein [Oscillospiraceae bacterium]
MSEKFWDKHRKLLGSLLIAFAVVFCAVITIFIGKPLIEFAKEPEKFQAWIDSFGIWGRLVFIGIIVLQVVIALIPGEPFEIAAGYAFGSIEGTLLCLAGIVLGSVIIFALVRKFGVKLVELFFPMEKINSLKFLKNKQRLNTIYFIVMCLPGTPKDLLSYFAGLTDMKITTWLLIATIARIPSVITSTIGGSALGSEQYVFAIIAFAATLALSGIGLLIYRKIQSVRSKSGSDE